MFEQDYLMRIIAQLIGAIRRSMERASGEENPDASAKLLDTAVGEATHLDGEAILSLQPDSFASIMQVSGVDPHLIEYLVRCLMLSARYYEEAGIDSLSVLRKGQAKALAEAFDQSYDENIASDQELLGFLEKSLE